MAKKTFHSCCGAPAGECPGCAEGSCLQEKEKESMDKQASVGRAAGLLAGGTAAGVKALTAPKGYKKEEAGKAFHRVNDSTTTGMLGGALGLLGGVGLHDVLDRAGVYGGSSSKPGLGQLAARLATLGLPPLAGAYLFGKGSYNRAKEFHGLTTREKQKRRADFEKELASQGFDGEEVAELTDHDDAELFGDKQSDLKTIQMDKQSVDNLLQWMDKQAVNRGLGSLPQGDGPQQMQYALQALAQARRSVDPTETLKRNKLKRKAFDQNIRTFAASNNPTYRFGDYKKDKKVEAVKSGLLGALLGGGLGALGGYLTGRPEFMRLGITGAAAGAGAGGALGFQRAAIHNDNLMRTAKTLKEYGLNQPSYLKEALPLLVDKSAKEDKPRHDACYHSVKRKYKVFPSAYASGAIAKCRKAGGPKKSKTSKVRKSQAGADLKRWFKEDWVNTRTGGDCGDGKGKGTPYCRPKKRVSSKTPKTKGEMSKGQLDKKKAEKNKVGLGDKVKPVQRKESILAASQRLASKESVIGPKPKPSRGGPIKKMVPAKPGPGRGGMMGPKSKKLSLQLPNNYTEAKQALYAAEAKMSQFDTLAAARQLRDLK